MSVVQKEVFCSVHDFVRIAIQLTRYLHVIHFAYTYNSIISALVIISGIFTVLTSFTRALYHFMAVPTDVAVSTE